jgi:hypothetical protein
MAITGHAIWKRDPSRIQRQLLFVCLAGMPLMVLQVLGAGEWSQVLRTDHHGDSYVDGLTQYPTLFVEEADLNTGNVLQPRPAGLFASNNALSLVLAIAVGLTMWQEGLRRTILPRDFLLAMVCVLAMSKTVYAIIAGIAFFAVIVGDASRRRSALRFVLFIVLCLLGYFLLFPGLWSVNMNFDHWNLNFALRLISFEQSLGIEFVPTDLVQTAKSLRPLLFDEYGDLDHLLGGLPVFLSGRLWVVALIAVPLIFVLASTLFRNTDRSCLVRNLSVHLVIVGITLVGINFLTSLVFALYIGSAAASICACWRPRGKSGAV